jgi:hypothetical protein
MGNMFVRWGSFAATVSGEITMTPGIDPDVFRIELAPESITIGATLTISDGNNTIAFQDCRAIDGSIEYAPDSRSASFFARDRRWRWGKLAPITGDYNRRDDAGTIVGEEKTAQELATLILTHMGETGYDVTGLSATDKPTVFWDYAPPAAMLSDLCSRYDARICLRTDNTVKIWAAGDGLEPNEIDRVSRSTPQRVLDTPSSVYFVGGAKRFQKKVDLFAVGYDPTKKEYYSLLDANLSWKPTLGYFPGWQQLLTGDDKKAARDTAFRAYRLPATITVGGTTYERAEILQYWSETINDKADIDGEERRREAYALGIHATNASLSEPLAVFPATDSIVEVDFRLIREDGIIIFNEPVFDIDSSTKEMKGAPLYLMCCFEVGRYTREVSQTGTCGVDILTREDIELEYDETGAVLNQTEADADADAYIAEHMLQYGSGLETARVDTYPGIEIASPDGKIEQVTYSLGAAGPTTTVCWNHEPGRKIPRAERQRIIDQARLVTERRNKIRSNMR